MRAARKHNHGAIPSISAEELHEAIRRRAEEIYARSGRVAGRDLENWVQAEAEVRRELEHQASRRAAIVVNVEGVRYTGEYDVLNADGYVAGEFAPGDPIPVRIDGDTMYVKRRNGRELETRIVHKTAGKSA